MRGLTVGAAGRGLVGAGGVLTTPQSRSVAANIEYARVAAIIR
jgi:hypothetical protein